MRIVIRLIWNILGILSYMAIVNLMNCIGFLHFYASSSHLLFCFCRKKYRKNALKWLLLFVYLSAFFLVVYFTIIFILLDLNGIEIGKKQKNKYFIIHFDGFNSQTYRNWDI